MAVLAHGRLSVGIPHPIPPWRSERQPHFPFLNFEFLIAD
jgi:hypothetical protein